MDSSDDRSETCDIMNWGIETEVSNDYDKMDEVEEYVLTQKRRASRKKLTVDDE